MSPVYNAITEEEMGKIRYYQFEKQILHYDNKLNFYDLSKKHLGFHSTDYWTPYLSAWARIGDFDTREIFKSLNSGDRIIRLNAFRTTLFVVHEANAAMIIKALGSDFFKARRNGPDIKKLTDKEVDKMLEELYSVLDQKQLKTRKIKETSANLAPYMRSLLSLGMARGKIIRATASHAKSNLTSYALLSQWSSKIKPYKETEENALNDLLMRYITQFAPVTNEDLTWWLRQPKKQVEYFLSENSNELVQFLHQETKYYMNISDYEKAVAKDQVRDQVITFLPYEDHFPKAFFDRDWYIDDKIRPKVFPRNAKSYWPTSPDTVLEPTSMAMNQSGEIRPSIWLDNQIIGRWEMDKLSKKEYKITSSIFQKVSQGIQKEIQHKQNELENFINSKLVPIS
ncbi:MAG: DNA glycosylase AlkZ-like family protein [Candidatus Kariarchaeaceae archaeon]